MSPLTGSWFFDIASVLVAIITIVVCWLKWSHTYWSRRGLLTPPTTFFYGNVKDAFTQKVSPPEFSQRLYRSFKDRKQIHGGFYALHVAGYVPVDLDLIKSILQSDFGHFVDRGMYYNEETDPLSAHLFALEGSKWRNLRQKLTPTFTSGKMKMMFETFLKCGDQLKTEMDKNLEKGPLDAKNILARFTTDVIGNCAFGIECNSLEDPDDNEFIRYLKLAFFQDLRFVLRSIFGFTFPDLARKLGVGFTNPTMAKFFMRFIKETVDYREKNNIYRKDFMQLLLQLKNQENVNEALTFNELAAQAFIFFFAGYETSSTTMTFCFLELASNPEIQERLRQEIKSVLEKHGKLTYEAIMDMHYMDKVINETLRKYPPLSSLNRICTKKYKVPGTDLVIEKGTKLMIPVFGIHHDPDHYPDPEKFDPERFSEESKGTRHPFAYLPFGEGPRICIGIRFGMMQVKIGLSVLLNDYKFSLNSKTNLPLKFDRKNFISSPEGGIWLDYAKI